MNDVGQQIANSVPDVEWANSTTELPECDSTRDQVRKKKETSTASSDKYRIHDNVLGD
jgi:hypothetical protein